MFRPTHRLKLVMAIMTLAITTMGIHNDNVVFIICCTYGSGGGTK